MPLAHPHVKGRPVGLPQELHPHRLEQAVVLLRAQNRKALLCIVVDAADNAQIAADEIGEARSFIRDLLREKIPRDVRLVALCRTHRLEEFLDPPPSALRLELKGFTQAETATHLRNFFPARASVTSMSSTGSAPKIQGFKRWRCRQAGYCRTFSEGWAPIRPRFQTAIGNLLAKAIAKLRDEAGSTERLKSSASARDSAVLRPLVPISVLSSMSDVPASAIKSFAVELGRPLVVTGETIQFFDEPAETWFREKFKPKAAQLREFITSIKPLSSGSPYVAGALPQLMLEAGQFDDLVALALSSEALPELSPLDRRDVELQRLQFALKASLREKRYLDAAKLALKAGGETAGEERAAAPHCKRTQTSLLYSSKVTAYRNLFHAGLLAPAGSVRIMAMKPRFCPVAQNCGGMHEADCGWPRNG